MLNKSLILRLFIATLAVAAHKPVFAEPGALRDTSDVSQWRVKSLGGPNEPDFATGGYTINETFEWQKERSYTDGALDLTGYVQPVAADGTLYWGSNLPWISVSDWEHAENGYYSFVTIINDSNIPAADPTASFSGLSVRISADDHLHAIIINGVEYEGFMAQDDTFGAWVAGYADLFILPGAGVPWNIAGDNTIEFIVHNSGWNLDTPNPLGLSATLQASYTSVVPEPPIALMFATGLLVLPLARRLRKTA